MSRFGNFALLTFAATRFGSCFSNSGMGNAFGRYANRFVGGLKCRNLRHFSTVTNTPPVSVSSLIGSTVPHFTTDAVVGGEIQPFDSSTYFKGSAGLLIFYPLDFTFVCPSELLGFSERLNEFESRGIKLVGVSVDSAFSHKAWKSLDPKAGGVKAVNFPLVSDLSKSITASFGLLRPEGFSQRASVLVDKDGKVRHVAIFDLGIGRSVDETLRVFDAIEFSAKTGDVCPLNWKKGEAAMSPTSSGTAQYLANKYNTSST